MHTRNLTMIFLLLTATIALSTNVSARHLNCKNRLNSVEPIGKQRPENLRKPFAVNSSDTIRDSCHRPVITTVTVVNPGGRLRVCYILPTPCDSCTIFVYNVFNGLVTSAPNICGSSCTTFKFLDSCSYYRFVIKCHNDTCGTVISDTFYYNGCAFRQGDKKNPFTPILKTIKGQLGYSANIINLPGPINSSEKFHTLTMYCRMKAEISSFRIAKATEFHRMEEQSSNILFGGYI